MERTLILLKPDCVQRRLMGRILSRFEDKGFNVIGMKMMRVTPELAKQHYAEHVSKPFSRLWKVSSPAALSWRRSSKVWKRFASCARFSARQAA